jgi:hypothetical protein
MRRINLVPITRGAVVCSSHTSRTWSGYQDIGECIDESSALLVRTIGPLNSIVSKTHNYPGRSFPAELRCWEG